MKDININELNNLKRKKCFIQFPHPGGEHLKDYVKKTDKKVAAKKPFHDWCLKEALDKGEMLSNKGLHRRKFMKNCGQYINEENKLSEKTDIMFWGEYECPTKFTEIEYTNEIDWSKEKEIPRYIHYEFFLDKTNRPRENTDPYIFGDNFYYSVCKQKINNKPNELYNIDRKSIILFGSCVGNKFVLDTLFVVKDFFPYDKMHIEKVREKFNLNGKYFNCGLEPLKYYHSENINNRSNLNMFYTGATYNNPEVINDQRVYSFFPCKLFKKGESFVRPTISFDEYKDFTDKFDKFKFNSCLNISFAITTASEDLNLELWNIVRKQVLEQGCYLGVWTQE